MRLRNSIRYIIISCIFALFVSSCLQAPSGGRKKSTSAAQTNDNNNQPTGPTFSSSLNYYQNAQSITTGNLNLATDFQDGFYLRGDEVNFFIKEGNAGAPQCHISIFSNSTGNQILITAISPSYFNNLQTVTREYYYLIRPNDKVINSNFCQTAGITNTLSILYPGKTHAYAIDDICPNCTFSSLLSEPSIILTSNGLNLSSSIDVSNLRINLLTSGTSSGNTTINSCTTNNECIAKGFDCCSHGQCVKDKQLKNGVDTTSNSFQQALNDISANPFNIFNYPQFYHLCSINIPPDATPTPRPDPATAAAERFKQRKKLYNCTTPIEGEMSLCTLSTTDVQSSGVTTFFTSEDDRNFNTTYTGHGSLPLHSLHEVFYAGEYLFQNENIIKGMTIGLGGSGAGNDNVSDKLQIDLSYTPQTSAPNDTLDITYKVDGSCERISTSLAKCYKIYVQGQNDSKITDHYPGTNNFKLPFYADTTKTVKVTVDDIIKNRGSHWNIITSVPPSVQFTGASTQVADTQNVKIDFYVSLASFPNIMKQKEASLDKIKEICECTGDCSLEEKEDNFGNVIDYICAYPGNDNSNNPLQKHVILSSKNTPHRYYDETGTYHKGDDIDSTTAPQEGDEFKYISHNLLLPNNVTTAIGFNEIYGSFTRAANSAKPAKEITVVRGKTYDIFTDSGSFRSCYFCGTDYYSNLARIFPDHFTLNGGGYEPDLTESNPFSASNHRKDDSLFGRACWIPATMIPWTHYASNNRQQQRLLRQAAQHTLFANGYQRDWYGFDYGSVIGSWDGVTWFSVGDSRRVKALSNKLFLAVNAYFGDLTLESSFSILVQDSITNISSTTPILSNIESSGAECQKQHLCNTDQDCAAQLGWEYSCESVTGLTSKWPTFDGNGLETPGLQNTVNLRNIFGATSASNNRCVYRGRGAACIPSYNTTNSTATYSGTSKKTFHHCSYNNHCQKLLDGVPVKKFNTKISRYGKSVKYQNASSTVAESDLDTFGMHIRSLGRPYSWIGTESIPNDAQSALSNNKILGICIPGRNPENDTLLSNHVKTPTNSYLGDKVNGIGMTTTGDGSDHNLSSCSIMDTNGDYLFKDQSPTNLLSDTDIQNLAGHQAISTNALDIFESSDLSGNELTENFENLQINAPILEANRCLRAPGSTCFSAMDCAPSSFIKAKVANVSIEDSSALALLNKYEIQFWQEELICSQELSPTDDDFELKNNRCCRETGLKVSIGTATNTGGTVDFDTSNVPGLGTIGLSNSKRYHRVSTIWDLLSGTQAMNYPSLEVVNNDSCTTSAADCADGDLVEQQYNTFSKAADRTCCSSHWVREFHQDNGGGHIWGPGKLQSIPKESLRCHNWLQCSGGNCGGEASDGYFSCSHTESADDPVCLMKASLPVGVGNTTTQIFDWLGTLELTGIPQVKVKTKDYTEILCQVNPNDQSAAAGSNIPPNILSDPDVENSEYEDDANNALRLYSAGDIENFNADNLKMIFSPDEVTCCLPAGTQVENGADPKRCCTGFINSNTRRCQLPDYTNVSLYMNRYISSAAQDEPVTKFDPNTGYLKSSADVIRLACNQNICASGLVRVGITLANLKVPGHESSDIRVTRFLDGNDASNNFSGLADLYDEGLRWNTHVYCVPQLIEIDEVVDCSNF